MKTEVPTGQHTPGPWEINDEYELKLLALAGNNVVATVYRREDAVLLKAAPELLAALKAIRKSEEDYGPALGGGTPIAEIITPEIDEMITAAIAKAEGQS